MKKVFFVFLVGLLTSAVFVGCGSTKTYGNTDVGHKSWTHSDLQCNKIATEGFGKPAIGVSGTSELSGTAAEKSARLDARGRLAAVLSSAMTNIEERADEASKAAGESTEEYKTSIKGVSNAVLDGAQQIDYFYDEKSGITYVLMGLPLDGIQNSLKSTAMKFNNKSVRDFLNELTIEEINQEIEKAQSKNKQ